MVNDAKRIDGGKRIGATVVVDDDDDEYDLPMMVNMR